MYYLVHVNRVTEDIYILVKDLEKQNMKIENNIISFFEKIRETIGNVHLSWPNQSWTQIEKIPRDYKDKISLAFDTKGNTIDI